MAGGGARAAYQAGVVSYIGRRRPEFSFPILTGVSAGAINSAFLASHPGGLGEASQALKENWGSLTTSRVFRSDPWSLLRIAVRWLITLFSGGRSLAPEARSLVDTRPLRTFLLNSLDEQGIRRNIASGHLQALAISVTAYDTGQTITFVEGAPDAQMWTRPQRHAERGNITVDHVMASAAIPILFPAVAIDGRYYGDGGIRQAAPLAPAVHLGASGILAISSRYDRSTDEARMSIDRGYPPPAQIIGLMFNTIFLDALDADAARLLRINRTISHIPPAERAHYDLRPVDLLVLRPSRDLGRLALEYQNELPRTLRHLVSGLGTQGGRNADFLSYLLFEPGYIGRLIRLGEEDAEGQWPRISSFLDYTAASNHS